MSKLTKSTIYVTGLLLISKVLGLFREILLADCFGASYIVDAYTIAITLPGVVFTVFASGFSNSYIPACSRVSKEKQNDFFNTTFSILTLISIGISCLCYCFAPFIGSFIAPGFEGKTLSLTIEFIRRVSFIFPLMTMFNVLCCQSQVRENFVFVSFCDYIVVNVVIIISILSASIEHPFILIYGYIISMAVAVILMFIYAIRKLNVKYKFCLDTKNADFGRLVSLAIPLGLSLMANQLNAVIDRMFASTLGEGITSSLGYANRIQLIPYSITVSVILTVCYPRISGYFAEKRTDEAERYIEKACMIALTICIPVVFCLCFFAEPITRLIYERGAFTSESTQVTAACLFFYSVGIPFYAFREIASKVLAANVKQKTILRNTVVVVFCNIILDFILVRMIGYRGLALATSIAGLISFAIMDFSLHRINIKMLFKHDLIDFMKLLLASAISTAICAIVFSHCESKLGSDTAILLGVGCLGISYCGLCLLAKTAICNWVISKLRTVFMSD